MKSDSKAFKTALAVIKSLRAQGHHALLAGGCVRDMLLDREPKDFDVATDATPEQVIALYPRARKVGAKFGVVLVRKNRIDLEVATFRSDGSYSDGRHPDSVRYGSDLEDARRRDFTINAIFFDPTRDKVIDHVNGVADLKAGIIRTVGDPSARFSEDHLRLLRAIRFAARLGFTIEKETLDAIAANAHKLTGISPERIWMELEAMLAASSRLQSWKILVQCGLNDFLVPDHPLPTSSTIESRLGALRKAATAELSLSCILLDTPRKVMAGICHGLRLSNRQTQRLRWLTGKLALVAAHEKLEPADLKTLMAGEDWDDLLDLLHASLIADEASLDSLERLSQRAAAIPPDQIAPPAFVTGADLLALNVTQGPEFGRIMNALYRAQLNNEVTDREEGLRLARQLMAGE